jgi:hypothetical protein
MLASGVPQQETKSFGEKLLIPLIHVVLLGFLPMWRMRRSTHPSYASGVGQLFVARREAYEFCGGHQAIASSRHDGVDLPRVFRLAGLRTDLFDATDLATCRMYATSRDTWRGFAKNADEGLGRPALILPTTALLLGGQVLPALLLVGAWPWSPLASILGGLGLALAYLPRWIGLWRFRQSRLSALLHPLGVLALVAIQWQGLLRRLLGRPAQWKGRSYFAQAPAPTAE